MLFLARSPHRVNWNPGSFLPEKASARMPVGLMEFKNPTDEKERRDGRGRMCHLRTDRRGDYRPAVPRQIGT
ncbi:hypothetical protein NITMOv2_1766 [Nitrospira moscoviensis]|uniref:Uncharacterized protein n=1 Tax=Nitrospira moscoviensis TaxID=42253 RepID=A0A0K2GB40_NITMO|nr:hypothetical protein NITMOv2_1766 [Nitrospira moscoviensis]